MSSKMQRSSIKKYRGKSGHTPFAPKPVTVIKTDPKTGEVLSKKVIQDPLAYDKTKRYKYFQENLKV